MLDSLLRIILITSFILSGCGGAEEAAEEFEVESTVIVEEVSASESEADEQFEQVWEPIPEEDAVLNIALGVDPWLEDTANFDPQQLDYWEAEWVLKQCLSAPFYNTGTVIFPDAVDEWQINDAFTEYTLKLNNKRQWSDGKPLVASDFRAGMLRTLSPDVYSLNASLLFGIYGARLYHDGELDSDSVGIEVLDDYTLVIYLEAPVSDFITVLSSAAAWPFREDFDYEPVLNGDLSALPCNGYYYIEEYLPGERLTVSRINDQIGAESVTVMQANFLFYNDQETRLSEFEEGNLDMVWFDDYSADQFEPYPLADYNLQVDTTKAIRALFFNTHSERVKDPIVRQALALATPHEIGEQIFGSDQVITADSLVNEGTGSAVPFDPELALTLLEQGGYEDLTLSILASEHSENLLDLLEEVRLIWEDLLGVTAEVTALPFSEYYAQSQICIDSPDECDYDIVLWHAAVEALYDPRSDAMLRLFSRENPNPALGGWTNDEFEELLAAARSIEPGDEYFDILDQAQQVLLYDDPAVIPFYYFPSYYAWDYFLLHIPFSAPVDPPPIPNVNLFNIWKTDYSIDDYALLAVELIDKRRDHANWNYSEYKTVCTDAIGDLKDWAAKVNLDWKPTADTVIDVAGTLSSIANTAGGPAALASFLYKAISTGKQQKEQKELSGALDKLKKTIDQSSETARKMHADREKKDKDTVVELHSSGHKFLLKLMTCLLLAETNPTTVKPMMRADGSIKWTVSMPKLKTPPSEQIEGEFLYQMKDMLGCKLHWVHTEATVWGRWGRPNKPAPPEGHKGIVWQGKDDKCKAIAARLTEIKFFKDKHKPHWRGNIKFDRVKYITLSDFESGIRSIVIDFDKSSNVKEVWWHLWTDKTDYANIKVFSKLYVAYLGKAPIAGAAISTKDKMWYPMMWLKVFTKDPNKTFKLTFTLIDGVENQDTFVIECKK